jgi:FkbM family methyltransferase
MVQQPPFSLIEMLGKLCPKITIIDAGAMDLGGAVHEGNEHRPLLKGGVGRVIGFEPVKVECDKLNARVAARGSTNEVYLPYAVGDGTKRTFHVCNRAMTSSLYEPNTKLLKLFQNLEELVRVVSTEEMESKRLDDLPEVAETDYLKLDIQGAELDVLRGATNLLRRVVVISTEVEFVPLYKEQPLFADVDTFLRSQGFVLHALPGCMGRAFKPMQNGSDVNAHFNQVLWAQVTYVKDFTRLDQLEPDHLLRLAVIMHEVYVSVDLASLALYHHDRKMRKGLWEVYVRRLTGAKGPLTPPDVE